MVAKGAPVWAVLLAAFVSGLMGVVLTLYTQARLDQRELKRDVLRRVAGHRHLVMPVVPGVLPVTDESAEPLIALNEAFIVFADEPEVLEALQELRTRDGSREVLVDLIKRMAAAADVDIDLNDAFINNPFRSRVRVVTPPAQ